MSQIISDNIISIAYLLTWVLTMIWYQRKQKSFDAGSSIIATYVLYAVISVLSLNDDFPLAMYEPLKFFPYIYLYVMLMIALAPNIYAHLHPTQQIVDPRSRVLLALSLLIIACSILLIPDVLGNFGQGVVKLFTDTSAGKDAYMEQIDNAGNSGNKISNLPAIVYNALSEIVIFLFFYFMTMRKKNITLLLGLAFAIVMGLLMPVIRGQRSGIILELLTLIVSYMLFKQYIAAGINRIIKYIGTIFIALILLPVVAITLSRFGDKSNGVGEDAIGGFLNWYIGQGNIYFNNYGLDAGGYRYGDRTINMAKRMVDSDTPKNYVERRDKYHNLEMDDDRFTTFVGDFTIDFGPVIAFIIFVIFNLWVLTQLHPRDGTIKLHQLLLLYFTSCVCMQGGMYLFSFSDTGNLRIIMFALLYIYLRYHEKLQQLFPQEKGTIEEP